MVQVLVQDSESMCSLVQRRTVHCNNLQTNVCISNLTQFVTLLLMITSLKLCTCFRRLLLQFFLTAKTHLVKVWREKKSKEQPAYRKEISKIDPCIVEIRDRYGVISKKVKRPFRDLFNHCLKTESRSFKRRIHRLSFVGGFVFVFVFSSLSFYKKYFPRSIYLPTIFNPIQSNSELMTILRTLFLINHPLYLPR